MAKADWDLIADAVQALIAGASLSQPFTPYRKALPRKTLEELDSGRAFVPVVSRACVSAGLSRNSVLKEHSIDIAVHAKVADDEAATLEPWGNLTQEIADLLEQGTQIELEDGRTAVALTPQVDPIYIPEHLEELHVFTAVIRTTFKLARAT